MFNKPKPKRFLLEAERLLREIFEDELYDVELSGLNHKCFNMQFDNGFNAEIRLALAKSTRGGYYVFDLDLWATFPAEGYGAVDRELVESWLASLSFNNYNIDSYISVKGEVKGEIKNHTLRADAFNIPSWNSIVGTCNIYSQSKRLDDVVCLENILRLFKKFIDLIKQRTICC